MTDKEPTEHKGFKVIDRRGQDREEESPPEVEGAEASPQKGTGPTGEAPLPGMDFSTFIVSLATSALYHMGLIEDPDTGKPAEPDLPLAGQTIDTLAILEDKTRGNLEPDETRLLESLLYDLRMHYVRVKG